MRNLGIVFSDRIQNFLLILLGVWIVFFAATAAWQITSSYVTGSGFDTSIRDVWIITVALFMPYLLVTGYMLRSLVARIAFYRLLRKQIVIAEYEPPKVLSPAEAGIIVDDEFSLAELAATLKDLELRGNVNIDWSSKDFVVTLNNKNNLKPPEMAFLNDLFRTRPQLSTGELGSTKILLSAGYSLASHMRAELVYTGQLPKNSFILKTLRRSFKLFLGLAVFVQLILTVSLVQTPEETLNVLDKSYPMHVSEPILVVTIIAAAFALIISGFWVRKLTDDHGLKNWRYVAGLKLYLDKVYKGRFYNRDRLTVTEQELKNFYPYAIALGIENDFTRKLERSLIT